MKKPRIVDRVWMLVSPTDGVVYCAPATSAGGAWENAIKENDSVFVDDEDDGYYTARRYLRKQGFRARKVSIVL